MNKTPKSVECKTQANNMKQQNHDEEDEDDETEISPIRIGSQLIAISLTLYYIVRIALRVADQKPISCQLTTKCPLCLFTPQNETSFSSSNDKVLIFCDNSHMLGLFPFVRSLRTANCRASIILFGMSLPLIHADFFSLCDVTIIPYTGERSSCSFFYNGKRIFEWRTFLHENPNVDRILACDTDIMFQGDPFSQPLKANQLVLSSEGKKLDQSGVNKEWWRAFHQRFPEPWDKTLPDKRGKPLLNAGMLLAYRKTMLRYFDAYCECFMRHSSNFSSFCGYSYDQAFLNAAFDNHLLGDISLVILHPTEAVFAFPMAVFNQLLTTINDRHEQFGNISIVKDPSRIYLAIHGWDKDLTLKQIGRNACPPIFPEDTTKKNKQIQ